jgi:hypothetical protein
MIYQEQIDIMIYQEQIDIIHSSYYGLIFDITIKCS